MAWMDADTHPFDFELVEPIGKHEPEDSESLQSTFASLCETLAMPDAFDPLEGGFGCAFPSSSCCAKGTCRIGAAPQSKRVLKAGVELEQPIKRLRRENSSSTLGSVSTASIGSSPSPSAGPAATRVRLCSRAGCSKRVKTGGLCSGHGGGIRCAEPGCGKHVVFNKRCVEHGGARPCKREGCTARAKRRGLCAVHGGKAACTTPGCDKMAVTRGLCFSHGGGRRCRTKGCDRRVRTAGMCWRHGQAGSD